jgi:acetyl-CoA carboxylase biotin carboxyl carrier protein
MASSGATGDNKSQDLLLLREEASNLVKTVPGPIASLSLRLGSSSLEITWAQPEPSAVAVGAVPVGATLVAPPANPETAAAEPADGVKAIEAPLVGTFYIAPEPGAGPFVTVGERVQPGQPVGIVEAMKLMNPVCSQWAGEVVEVLVDDGEPVEFGQPLVRIRPSS